jgi:hypothetical protein
MKLLYCNTCRDIVKLNRTTRTCHCGATGGHYKQDGLNAIYYGPAIPLGFANSSFHEAIDSQPEFGMGTNYNAFVIPKVCPTMVHVDLSDYVEPWVPIDPTEVYEDEASNQITIFDEIKERQKDIKKIKIKNVFKNED